MKKSSPISASHVNIGTSIPRSELDSNGARGREFRAPKIQAVVEEGDATASGGLALAVRLLSTLKAPQLLDGALSLLKQHRPFTESDHVLTHVYNLFSGGTCIEDIANLQGSKATKRLLGAKRIPDPTTAGDFLRRFEVDDIAALDEVTDNLHRAAWQRRYGSRKQACAMIDIDSHVHHVYGDQKEGTDFTYKGGFGYHPLVVSIAGTQECLRLVNRPGNLTSADGADKVLESVMPLLKSRFKQIIVRGDSAFAQQPIFDMCDEQGVHFAMVSPCQGNFGALADAIDESKWQSFRANPKHADEPERKRRKRGKNVRAEKVEERGKHDLHLKEQWISEVSYQPKRSPKPFRLIVRRQLIDESRQGQLFKLWRYRYVISNLPLSVSAEKVVRMTYQRCDQENVIEQLQSGVTAMRMPTGGFNANWAFLACARIAHNLKAWLAMIALPDEVMRWEWKRFRNAFVHVAARVVTRGRQLIVRFADSHRFARRLTEGIAALQS